MKRFEERISEGKYYLNFDKAYEQYVLAQQAKDAIIYGKNSTINPKDIAQALDQATSLMEPWTAQTYDKTTTFNSNQTAPTDAFTNATYLEANNDAATVAGGLVDNTYMNVYLHNGVYIYDATNPQIPIMFGYQTKNRSGNVTDINYISLSNDADSSVAFVGEWKTNAVHGDNTNRYNHFTESEIKAYAKAIQDAIDGLKYNYIVRFTLSSTYEKLNRL